VTIKALCHIRFQEVDREELQHQDQSQDLQFSGADEGGGSSTKQPYKREQPKVGRNEPCPCGSGRKFKKCCGR
jgi:preprotein translocase subunit SecA